MRPGRREVDAKRAAVRGGAKTVLHGRDVYQA